MLPSKTDHALLTDVSGVHRFGKGGLKREVLNFLFYFTWIDTVPYKQLCIKHFFFPSSGYSINFAPGKTYKYKYETVVNFNEAVSYGKTVGFQLTTEFEIGEVFRASDTQLLKVQVQWPWDMESEIYNKMNIPKHFF